MKFTLKILSILLLNFTSFSSFSQNSNPDPAEIAFKMIRQNPRAIQASIKYFTMESYAKCYNMSSLMAIWQSNGAKYPPEAWVMQFLYFETSSAYKSHYVYEEKTKTDKDFYDAFYDFRKKNLVNASQDVINGFISECNQLVLKILKESN